MSSKTDFTPEEWKLVLASPAIAGTAVTLADPSGLWGLLKEGIESGRAMREVRESHPDNRLIGDVVADFGTWDGMSAAREGMRSEMSGKAPEDIKRAMLQRLSDVSRLLDAKAPADAAVFKDWLRRLAERVAEASKEGGFLGFGGVAVSDAEKATLADITAALGDSGPATATS